MYAFVRSEPSLNDVHRGIMVEVTRSTLRAFVAALRHRVRDFHQICFLAKTMKIPPFSTIYISEGHLYTLEDVVKAMKAFSPCMDKSLHPTSDLDAFANHLLIDVANTYNHGYGTSKSNLESMFWTYIAAFDHFFFWGVLTDPIRYRGDRARARGQPFDPRHRPFKLDVTIGPNRASNAIAFWSLETGTIHLFTDYHVVRHKITGKELPTQKRPFQDMVQSLVHELCHVAASSLAYYPDADILWRQAEFDEGHGIQWMEMVVFLYERLRDLMIRAGIPVSSLEKDINEHLIRLAEVETQGPPPLDMDAISFYRRRIYYAQRYTCADSMSCIGPKKVLDQMY